MKLIKKKLDHTIGNAVVKVVKNPVQAILGLIAVLGFFSILGVLLFKDIPIGVKDILLTLFGCLTTIVVQVYQFYFGSSKGSQEKTETIHNKLTNKDTPAE